jgi:hypothetical protein
VSDGEERDVRDSLGDLERRLLDLARELRTGASEDTEIAAGAPGAPPPPAPEPAPPAPPPPPQVPQAGPSPAEPDPELARLAGEAQRKVEALRDSLDGLEHASDRLRETAQTVVEDHGRALVRLERATAPRPPAPPLEPPVPAAAAPPEPEAEPEPGPPAPPAEPEPAASPAPMRRGRWVAAGLAAGMLLLLALLGVLLASGGDDEPAPGPPPPDAFAARILVGSGVPDIGLADPTPAATAAALRAVCRGDAAAALVTFPAGPEPEAPCRTAAVLARETLDVPALAVRIPPGGGGRRCVSAGAVGALRRSRRDSVATAARESAVLRATRDASAGARRDGLPPAGVVRAGRGAGAAAGTAFDRARRLRLLAVRSTPGGPCARPGTVRYPLGRRVALVASSDAAGTAEVERAAANLRTALGGAAPVSATVLRAR